MDFQDIDEWGEIVIEGQECDINFYSDLDNKLRIAVYPAYNGETDTTTTLFEFNCTEMNF